MRTTEGWKLREFQQDEFGHWLAIAQLLASGH